MALKTQGSMAKITRQASQIPAAPTSRPGSGLYLGSSVFGAVGQVGLAPKLLHRDYFFNQEDSQSIQHEKIRGWDRVLEPLFVVRDDADDVFMMR
ncbi:hypothetical protein E5D57_008353 [Metarhizium anisopliae]|nr:hypothetical protein E5D57_008353 [Metarhizium anisopliae]